MQTPVEARIMTALLTLENSPGQTGPSRPAPGSEPQLLPHRLIAKDKGT